MAKRKRKADPGAAWEATVQAALDELAVYNAERARGIVHTSEWEERMAKRQAHFDEETAAQARWKAESFAAERRKRVGLPPSITDHLPSA